MNTNMLDAAVVLSDGDLLARIPVLAAQERGATAHLVAHLAALRLRPSLYAAQGYGSLFAYCRGTLRLSEDAAANRIHAARACLRFPVILEGLASGELSLSAVRMLRPHLTIENHERVLSRARNARRVDIERLVAEIAPRPDVRSSVRRLPAPRLEVSMAPAPARVQAELPRAVLAASSKLDLDPTGPLQVDGSGAGIGSVAHPALANPALAHAVPVPVQRPVLQPLSPERYRVQFTMGQDAYNLLQRVQTLLRREIPDGDTGEIFERALRVLHREVEAAKFGKRQQRPPAGAGPHEKRRDMERVRPVATAIKPGPPRAYENRIRPGADPGAPSGANGPNGPSSRRVPSANERPSRYVPKAVKRAVWYRDRGRCAFVSTSGKRCLESDFLELHHIHPYALDGPTTVENLSLRCRAHNQYESELVFGTRQRSALTDAETGP